MSKWPLVKLSKFASKIGSGSTPRGGKKVYLDKGPISLIRSQNIYNEGFKKEGLVYIDEEQGKKLSNVKIQKDDILINITGDSVARVCLAPNEYIPARVNQHVMIIRLDPTEFDQRFVRYYLSSTEVQTYLKNISSTGGTRNAITKTMIENLEVPKPPLNVQRGIGDIISTFDDTIIVNNACNETLENIAQAIFKSWFVDFDPVKAKMEVLNSGGSEEDATKAAMSIISGNTEDELIIMQSESPSEYNELKTTAELFPLSMQESELGEIPEGWKVKTVDNLVKNDILFKPLDGNHGGIHPKGSDFLTSGIPFIMASDLRNGSINFDKCKFISHEQAKCLKKGKSIKGDVLFTHKATIGRVAIVPELEDEFIVLTPQVTYYRVKNKELFNNHFLYYYFKSTNFQTIFKMWAGSGSTRSYLGITKQLALPILYLPVELQNIFSEVANIEKIHSNISENKKLEQLKNTLLPKLLSGELDVSNIKV